MNTNQFLDHFYSDTDYVCVFLHPAFEKTRQRFVYIAELKTTKWQRFLKFVNGRGCNVYLSVYPFQCRQRTEENVVDQVDRVFLDFDEEGPYQAFRQDYNPQCVIQTSPGKYQCFLGFREPASKEQAKAASRGLAAKYGADHAFDLSRLYRLPGFRNMKYPQKLLAHVMEVNLERVYPLEELPMFMQDPKPQPVFNPETSFQKKRFKYCYDHFLTEAPRKVNGDPDFSSSDYSYCIYLFSRGFDDWEARSALLRISPHLKKRKGGGLDNYLNKTLSRAKQYQLSHDRQLAPVG